MKFFNTVSLRMRITLLTGVIILVVALLLTYASMYNAGNRIYALSTIMESVGATKITEPAVKNITLSALEMERSEVLPMSTVGVAAKAVKLKAQFAYWSYIYMFFIAGAGMIVCWFVAGRALKPVRRLSEAAVDIGGHNLTRRIPLEGTRDEVGELTEAFNDMLDRLEESFDRQKRFSSNVAHELKTPLATLKLSMQVGRMENAGKDKSEELVSATEKEGEGAEEEAEDVFSVAERSIDRLIHVVDGLLTLTNEGTLSMEDSIELGTLLRGITEELMPLYRDKNLQVEYAFYGEECLVLGDAGLVRRIFYNLIENAMKYNGQDGSLKLIIEEKDGQRKVTVADSGAGMAPEEMEHIFEPFYCVDPSRSRRLGGAGLGLSIAKAAAERHGWTLTAESVVDAGTSFIVTMLPSA